MNVKLLAVVAAVAASPVAWAETAPAAQDAATAAKAEGTGMVHKTKVKAKVSGKQGVAKATDKAARVAPAPVTEAAKAKGDAGVDKGVDAAAAKLGDKLQ
jgi:hypothetical protein